MTHEKNDAYEEALALKTFVVLTRALESVKARATEDIKRLGLNPTEFAVLELIYSKGDQPIQKIGEKVLIASSSITYVVDKLEAKALLKREPCPTDRRVTHASMTTKGRELMDEVFPEHKKKLVEILGGLTVEEKEQLITYLKRLGLHAQDLA